MKQKIENCSEKLEHEHFKLCTVDSNTKKCIILKINKSAVPRNE